MMLTRLLHSLVARPGVYDAVQAAAGASLVRAKLRHLVPPLPDRAIVLDIGGGTGLYRDIWPVDCRYVCLDLDPLKLQGFRRRFPDTAAVGGDATRLPVESASIDAVACTLMAHHLTDAQLTELLDEIARVLKPGGKLLFADPLWRPRRLPGRLLWRYDRGAHPRTSRQLCGALRGAFEVERWTEFALWHHYAACIARRR
jgi:SAM-dependent methyltransferase